MNVLPENVLTDLATFVPFEKYPDTVAFIEQSAYRTQKYTYAQIQDSAIRIANSLREQGIATGDKVILWGQNSALWAMTFYACLYAGIVVVPMDSSFSEDFVGKIRGITQAKRICSDRNPGEWRGLLNGSSDRSVLSSVSSDPRALLEIIYTSGTTGMPKGVMITHENVLSNLLPIRREYQKYRKYARPFLPLRFVHLIPLSHLFGQIMGLFLPQMLPGTVIFSEPAAPNVVRAVRNNRASVVVCVPQELAILRKHIAKKHDIEIQENGRRGVAGVAQRWWRYRNVHRDFGWKFWAFVVGGATLPQAEESFWSGLGFAVIQGYGLTETAPSVTITHPFKGIKSGSVGRKLPGLEIKIAEDGEILVRGPNVTPGYYQNEEATKEVLREGWLHTGDIGRFDEDGNLILLGRKKEVIVTSEGLNVYPDDVETVLNSDPRVRESAVVARESDGKTSVHAVLVLNESVDASEAGGIIARANEKLEAHQRIQSVSIWPEPELPRTTTGKLRRLAIAQGTPFAAFAEKKGEDLLRSILAGGDSEFAKQKLQEELGLSSLERMELLVELEEASGTHVDDAAFARAKTVGDVARLLRQQPEDKAAAGPAYPFWTWQQLAPFRYLRTFLWHVLTSPMMRLRIDLRTEGLQNLQSMHPPVLFVSNHQSIIDVPVILKALPRRFRKTIAPAMGIRRRLDLYAAGFFFNAYPLPNTPSGLRDALRHTGELVDNGYSPLVFPEGARTETGRLLPFRAGIGVIARHVKLPVIPVLLQGAYEIWPVHARGPSTKGVVVVRFGEAFDFSGKEPAEITKILEAWYESNYKLKTI